VQSESQQRTYRCRYVKPRESVWYPVTASSPEEAATDFHGLQASAMNSIVYENKIESGIEKVFFAKVEVEGFFTRVSRVFSRGIYRKGGVRKTRPITLEDIVKKLDYDDSPESLLEEGWDCEESEFKSVSDGTVHRDIKPEK